MAADSENDVKASGGGVPGNLEDAIYGAAGHEARQGMIGERRERNRPAAHSRLMIDGGTTCEWPSRTRTLLVIPPTAPRSDLAAMRKEASAVSARTHRTCRWSLILIPVIDVDLEKEADRGGLCPPSDRSRSAATPRAHLGPRRGLNALAVEACREIIIMSLHSY
ncbi:hypothetical protein DFH08DRAFT_820253 [Mycena albidolilacea]|uniref:Uncharacterized protein n=1 Tax=Mycena albidolilacea TaxID=1033008 RepID=A0AAD7EEP1_9AGAR|nr:hypothetical protein DFH08DRAFT_820253 [Mycena albidolilacea]